MTDLKFKIFRCPVCSEQGCILYVTPESLDPTSCPYNPHGDKYDQSDWEELEQNV